MHRLTRTVLLATTGVAAGACLTAAPAAPAAAATPRVVPRVAFTNTLVANVPVPTKVAKLPDGRMLVASQTGQLRVLSGGRLLPAPALSLVSRICADHERGLLGIAADPAFTSNHRIYLYWTRKGASGICSYGTLTGMPVNRISRFVLGADNKVAAGSEKVLADHIPNPMGFHNAGDLAFGADGMLYASVGDAICTLTNLAQCGPDNSNSRRLDLPLGKILRITRDGGIPGSNPYAKGRRCTAPTGVPAGTAPCAETYAHGFRNPFRFAVKPGTSTIYVNDVGDGTWEEVDRLVNGADYGWNVCEGNHLTGSTAPCGMPAFTAPLMDYHHGPCGAITAAAFVPAGTWGSLSGSYLFGDYVCGALFQLSGRSMVRLATTPGITSAVFGRDGALYYTTELGGGQLRRLVRAG